VEKKGKEIYTYDPDHGKFERVPRGVLFYTKRIAPYAAAALTFGGLLVLLFYLFFDSPKARTLKYEQQQLNAAIASYKARIDSMQQALTLLEKRNKELYRSILDAEPIEQEEEKQAEPEANSDAIFEQGNMAALQQKVEELSSKLQAQTETNQLMYEIARLKKKELAFIPSIRPVITEIISGFGIRKHPIFKKDIFHAGIDFKADQGTPVRATADGTVADVGNSGQGLGLIISLNHHNGYVTKYGHLSRSMVHPGQPIKRGQLIGYSGNSGLSKGPHLYYEIQKGNKPVDPIDFFFNDLKPDEYVGFRRKAAQYNESMS
jgi:murein DD-endopeptidase MepM/ murein hydrolase activator NlpD